MSLILCPDNWVRYNQLKANGLQIAVENWPHEDIAFPVENDYNMPIQTSEEIYAAEFLSTALQDSNYSGGVISIPPTTKYPCYFAKISNTANLSLYENKHARLILKPTVFGTGGDIVREDPNRLDKMHHRIIDVVFHVFTRIFVKDKCNDFFTIKTVMFEATTNGEGIATLDVAYATNAPVIKVVGFTRNDKVQVGECHGVDSILSTWPYPVPKYEIESSKEELSEWCDGSTAACTDQSQIFETFHGYDSDGVELWQIQAVYETTDDRLQHPNAFIVYDYLRKISSFLDLRGFDGELSDFRACEWDNIRDGQAPTAAAWPKNHGQPTVIIGYRDNDRIWDFANPIVHESGHALQFNMQAGIQHQVSYGHRP